jgi:hypothetical protein
MNRWILSLSLLMLAACQTGATQTADVEQAATSGDCIPGNNYQDAKLPSLPLWNGSKPPAAGPGQVFLDVADWRANTQSTGEGFHVGVLADPGTGEILWGATIPDGKLGTFRAASSIDVRARVGDCCMPPPCGCRTCCDKGLVASWMARNFLEVGLRTVDDRAFGAEAAGPLDPKKW